MKNQKKEISEKSFLSLLKTSISQVISVKEEDRVKIRFFSQGDLLCYAEVDENGTQYFDGRTL